MFQQSEHEGLGGRHHLANCQIEVEVSHLAFIAIRGVGFSLLLGVGKSFGDSVLAMDESSGSQRGIF